MLERMLVFAEEMRSHIDARLRGAVDEVASELLRGTLRHALAGGKRVRPMMTMMACATVGGRSLDALEAGVAIEMLHTASLVHDDIMDASNLRRGQETVHHRFGVPAAVLTGDALVAMALRTIQRLDHPRKDEIVRQFGEAYFALCEGQGDDLGFAVLAPASSEAHTTMVRNKTARLLECAARAGALIGTEEPRAHEALARFGLNIGMAYQAHDDLLDLTGTEEVLGKPVGVDARNGRQTFLTVRGNGDDVVAHAASIVESYTAAACKSLDDLPPSEAREFLRALAGSLIGREM